MVDAAASVARGSNDGENDDPTQPFSSPGSVEWFLRDSVKPQICQNGRGLVGRGLHPYATQDVDHKDKSDNDDGKGMKKVSNDEESTMSDSDEQNKEAIGVDMTCRNNMVAWKDADGQTQCIEGLYLDLYMDTSTNTAIFKLYGYILLKGNKGKSSKQAVYLYIHPEKIQTITLETVHGTPSPTSTNLGPTRHSLCFSLATEPHLVAPKTLILESRPKTAALLDSIQALATVTNFTVFLSNLDTVIPAQNNLELIASVFSSTYTGDHPSTNNRRANLATLYAGKGGEIVRTNETTTNVEARPPPSYSAPAPDHTQISNKRKRKSSDIDGNRSPTTHDHILLVLKDICTRLDTIENRMGQLEDKVSEALDVGRSPCRYGTEERTDILEEVDNRVDDCITDLKVESHDIIQELKDEIDGTLERLDNETSDRMERLEGEVEENTTKIVEKCLRKKLVNASLRVDGTVFLDI
ncbi:hypothetical protein ACHAQJ_000991 [Trichoderma viride]